MFGLVACSNSENDLESNKSSLQASFGAVNSVNDPETNCSASQTDFDVNVSSPNSFDTNNSDTENDTKDYNARSNLMWAATMAENRIIKLGKLGDFECHQMEHQLGAYTNCNHGEGPAVPHPIYYRHIYTDCIPKFKRFAVEVRSVNTNDMTDEETALTGVKSLADFIKEIGIPTTFAELGIYKNIDLEAIANSCNISTGSLRKITHEEIYEIFKECVK